MRANANGYEEKKNALSNSHMHAMFRLTQTSQLKTFFWMFDGEKWESAPMSLYSLHRQ